MPSDASFEWDDEKNRINQDKHGVSFELAQRAFLDPHRVIAEDLSHGRGERRFFCFGQVGAGIMTVRFTYRAGAHPDLRSRVLAERQANL